MTEPEPLDPETTEPNPETDAAWDPWDDWDWRSALDWTKPLPGDEIKPWDEIKPDRRYL
jgi:hypothetical protein